MIPIYICEDIEEELQTMIKTIDGTIKSNNLNDISVICATKEPSEVIDQTLLATQPGIYFLDVDLGKEVMNGIELGAKIRAIDSCAYIVMVTSHSQAAPLTYKYKIGAKDYILKDYQEDMKLRIRDSVIDGFKLFNKPEYLKRKMIYLSNETRNFSILIDQIYYIEVLKGKKNRLHICQGNLFDIANSSSRDVKRQLDKCFCRCNKTFVINLNYVKEINYKERLAIMKGGKQIPISVRCLPYIKKFYLQFNQNFTE